MGDGHENWFATLDRVLRGEATRPSALLRHGRLGIPIGGLAAVAALLATLYGACMGSYAISHAGGTGWPQVLASALKVPALFFLTLVVTFPSLYVSNALVGSRLGVGALLGLLVAALAVTTAVLASLGPIVAFFSLVSASYAFIKLMNVVACAASGALGLGFLLQTLHRLTRADEPWPRPSAPPAEEPPAVHPPAIGAAAVPAAPRPAAEPIGALDRPDDAALARNVKVVFGCWVALFGLVGAQMAWVLRPFIGAPGLPFAVFRPRQSNFFEDVARSLAALLQG